MPSSIHNVIVELLEAHPEALGYLLNLRGTPPPGPLVSTEGEARGKIEGKAEGKAEGVLTVLAARGVPVSDALRKRILGCTDIETLDLWLRRAAVASTAAAVVGARTARPAAKRPAPRTPKR